MASPYDGEEIAVVPPLNPDVTIIHAQRADADGNVQVWGIVGVQREAALAAERVIAVVEELVDCDRSSAPTPTGRCCPGIVVDAVCVEPFGAHPSFAQGYYDRDNAFYRDWDADQPRPRAARRRGSTSGCAAWTDRAAYVERMGRRDARRAAPRARAPRGASTTGATGDGATPDELMIAAAAAELAGVRTVFVGIGLPNAAANLARQSRGARPRADLRVGRGRGATDAPARQHRRPGARLRGGRHHEHARPVRRLPAGRPDRGRACWAPPRSTAGAT